MFQNKMLKTIAYYYILVQGFRVTFLYTGQYNTGYDTITDVIVAAWIKILLLLQSLVWLLGFGANH